MNHVNSVNGHLPPTDAAFSFSSDCPDLVREYCRLASTINLSEAEADRLNEILELAESDGRLDFWLNEADHFLAHELSLTSKTSIYNVENQQAKLREYLEQDEVLEELRQQLKISPIDLQQHLKRRGFDPGPIDGYVGPRTHSALVAFQEAHHLIPHGIPDATTREALGLRL